MTKTFRDYARSFAENLDARKAYRWASGLCATTALAFALDTACTDEKYTPPKDTRTDIEVILDVLGKERKLTFGLSTRKEVIISKISLPEGSEDIAIRGVDTKLTDWVDYEHLTFYPTEKRFEPAIKLKDSPNGLIALTEEEVEEVKTEYREAFSDIAKSLRRNVEIERMVRADVLRTGKIGSSHKVSIFDYSWIPSWLSTLFSRTVINWIEKEYDTESGRV